MLWILSKLCEIILRRKVELVKEICWFHKYKKYYDGLELFDIHMYFNYYIDDHNPSFEFCIVLLNYIFEFNVYNIYHIRQQEIRLDIEL